MKIHNECLAPAVTNVASEIAVCRYVNPPVMKHHNLNFVSLETISLRAKRGWYPLLYSNIWQSNKDVWYCIVWVTKHSWVRLYCAVCKN